MCLKKYGKKLDNNIKGLMKKALNHFNANEIDLAKKLF